MPPCQLEFTAKGYVKQNPCTLLSSVFNDILVTSVIVAVKCFMM
jgi:hypothetical protein